MGLTLNMVRLLASSKQRYSLEMGKILMIGRQNLHLGIQPLCDLLDHYGYEGNKARAMVERDQGYAEGLLELMGAQSVDSLDASSYENATLIADLNQPIAPKHKNQFDLVLDSGTLEHVFHITVALQSLMEMVTVGGYFVGIYPCNNLFGHGFYQFSSELFYRAFSKENGFEACDVILFADQPDTTFYSVPDTSEKHQRITFTNEKELFIYVLAKKTKDCPLFEAHPQQMDYSQIKWQGKRKGASAGTSESKKQLRLPAYWKNLAKALLNKKQAGDEKNFKKPYFTIYKP